MKKMQTSEDEDCELTSKDVFNKILYRTKTYIAADWSGDYDAVEQLHKWNISNYWSLS